MRSEHVKGSRVCRVLDSEVKERSKRIDAKGNPSAELVLVDGSFVDGDEKIAHFVH